MHVEGVAISGVGVADNRDVHGVGDVLGVGDHFGHGQQAHVGEAPLGGGARAGHVYGVEPDRLGDSGVEGIEDKGGYDQPIGVQHLA